MFGSEEQGWESDQDNDKTKTKERASQSAQAGPPSELSLQGAIWQENFRKQFSLSFSKLHLPPPPHFKNQLQPPKEEKIK